MTDPQTVRVGVQVSPQHLAFAQRRDRFLRCQDLGVDDLSTRGRAALTGGTAGAHAVVGMQPGNLDEDPVQTLVEWRDHALGR